MTVSELLDGYVHETLASNPIAASKLGVHDYDHALGDISRAGIAATEARHSALLTDLERHDPSTLDGLDRLDWQTGVIEARTAIARDAQRIWERAPYLYSESLGDALSVLMTREFASIEQRAEALRARLDGIAEYLREAQANLGSEAPPIWVQMGHTSAAGLERFVSESVPDFAEQVGGSLGADIRDSCQIASEAVTAYRRFVEELSSRASGPWACGSEFFDFLLKEYHLLDIDHEALYELGRQTVETDTARLVEYAAALDPDNSWQMQIARIKDKHPQPAEFKETYHHELKRAREHTLAEQLATLPDGEVCTMAWVPEFMRASLPIAVMSTTPPFEDGLASQWLITPSDPSAPEERRMQQMRDNCYVFAESIAGHEIYPGHHLQKVHHKLGTRNSMIRRYFSCPQFVEGWGLYVEDLFEETGFFANSAVLLFKLRNALWRSLRVVIDVGIHTKDMTFEQAVDLLQQQAAMDRHMAEGEVRRYTRHDNPTYPSSYLLGRLAIHDLRGRYQESTGDTTLLTFHDTLLSFGSLPLKLVAEQMLTRADATQDGRVG